MKTIGQQKFFWAFEVDNTPQNPSISGPALWGYRTLLSDPLGLFQAVPLNARYWFDPHFCTFVWKLIIDRIQGRAELSCITWSGITIGKLPPPCMCLYNIELFNTFCQNPGQSREPGCITFCDINIGKVQHIWQLLGGILEGQMLNFRHLQQL